MTRPSRINLPSCLFHIMCRGNLQDPIFLSDGDRRRFLFYLGKYCDLFDFRVHTYCLMKTHIHLLAESTEDNLSEFMRRLLTAYTVWFHKRHQSHGHLFSGRFKSLVVERGDYMLALWRYIHLNPVDAGIARFPEDYPWSSMRAFLDRDKAPPFLFMDEILGWFDGDPTKYAEFVREGLSEDTKPEIMQQRYVGSKPFARRIAARMDALGCQDALLPEERMRKKKKGEGPRSFIRRKNIYGRHAVCMIVTRMNSKICDIKGKPLEK